MIEAIISLFAAIITGINVLFLIRQSKNSLSDAGVLKEVKIMKEHINKLIDNFNHHNKILIDYDETFKKIFNIELGFNSEIRQIKNAVAQLQNMVIDSQVEED